MLTIAALVPQSLKAQSTPPPTENQGNASTAETNPNVTITDPPYQDPKKDCCGRETDSEEEAVDEEEQDAESCAEATEEETALDSVYFRLPLGKVRFVRPVGFFEMDAAARKHLARGAIVDRAGFDNARAALLKSKPFLVPAMEFYAHTLTADSYKPSALRMQHVNWGLAEVLKSNGVLRQIATRDLLTDITALPNDGGTLIRMVLRSQLGPKGSDGFYTILSGVQPFKEITITNPNPVDFTQLAVKITERFPNQDEKSWGWRWTLNPATGQHVMSRLDGPLQVIYKREQTTTTDLGNGLTRIIRAIEHAGDVPANGQQPALHLISRTLEEQQDFGNGQKRLMKLIEGYGGTQPLTTEYTHFTDPNDGYTYLRLKTLKRSDGYWETYRYERNPEARIARMEKRIVWKNSAFDSQNDCRLTVSTYESNQFTREERVAGQVIRREFQRWENQPDASVQITKQRDTGAGLLTQTIVYHGESAPAPQTGRIKHIVHQDNTVTRYAYATSGSNVVVTKETGAGTPSAVTDGVRVVTTVNSFNRLVEESRFDIASGLRLSRQQVTEWDTFGRATKTLFDDDPNDFAQVNFVACCGVGGNRARNGTVTQYHHDALKRQTSAVVVTGTRTITRRFSYAPEMIGNEAYPSMTTFRSANGGPEEFVSQIVKDLQGRTVLTRSPDANGDNLPETTTYAYDASGDTVTRPDGSTQIDVYFSDGALASRRGTGVRDYRMEYGAHSLRGGGIYIKEIRLKSDGQDEGWAASCLDLAGRLFRVEQSAFGGQVAVDEQDYNALGQPETFRPAGNPAVKLVHSQKGEAIEQWVDRNGDGQFNNAMVNGRQDARIGTSRDVVNDALVGVSRRTRTWTRADSNQDVLTAAVWRSSNGLKSATELPGRGLTVVTRAKPFEGTSSSNTVVKDTQGAALVQASETQTINAAGETLIIRQQKDGAGNPVIETEVVLDSFGRPVAMKDGRNNTSTFAYYPNEAMRSRTDANGDTTTWLRNAMGQVTVVCLPGSNPNDPNAVHLKKYASYTLAGDVEAIWGAQTTPVRYGYDEQGRLATLVTFRSDAPASVNFPHAAGSGDTTTWVYDPGSGFLQAKRYPDNTQATYVFDIAGRVAQRTWARGVSATYEYVAGQLSGIDYSDATPDVTLAYDRAGNLRTASNANATYIYGVDPGTLRNTGETVTIGALTRVITRGYDVAGRPSLLRLSAGGSSEHETGFHYGIHGRIDGISATGVPNLPGKSYGFAYGYVPGTDFVQTLKSPAHVVSDSYETKRDLLKLKSNGRSDETVISAQDYTINAVHQPAQVIQAGEYVPAGQQSGWNWFYNARGELTGADHLGADPAFNHAYEYDPIGNRRWATVGHADLGQAPSQAPTSALSHTAYTANALNQYGSMESVIQGSTVSPAYDLDGNLKSDAGQNSAGTSRSYEWDAENRLTAVRDANNALIASYAYDAFSRRVAKTTPGEVIRYIYDSWRVLAEYRSADSQVPPGAPHAVHVWGVDLEGRVHDGSGVGGLLASRVQGTIRYYLYDGSGNVTEVLDSSAVVQAHYEYGPFGQVLRSVGSLADSNLIRSSTKQIDPETGLSYYGHRYYSALTGRWLSRDPSKEAGGLNLYAFVENQPGSRFDALGLKSNTSGSTTNCTWTYTSSDGEAKFDESADGMLVMTGWEYTSGLEQKNHVLETKYKWKISDCASGKSVNEGEYTVYVFPAGKETDYVENWGAFAFQSENVYNTEAPKGKESVDPKQEPERWKKAFCSKGTKGELTIRNVHRVFDDPKKDGFDAPLPARSNPPDNYGSEPVPNMIRFPVWNYTHTTQKPDWWDNPSVLQSGKNKGKQRSREYTLSVTFDCCKK